ncbi:MAG TPA: hypothetical protein PK529_08600 [Verrucomicrobiales bacterium]|nr:hypothetical protein [Verrucomicrobiales bacterium]
MRKTIIWGVAAAFFTVLCPVSAEIVVEEFIQSGTGKVASGYVLQGSRNLKHLGKGRTVSAVRVPALSTLAPGAVPAVIPALQNQELELKTPKPRFGYGSDYKPDGAVAVPPQVQQNGPGFSFAPIYQSPRIYAYRSSFAPFPYFYFPGASDPCHSLLRYSHDLSYPYSGAFSGNGCFAFSFQSPSFRYFGFR